MFVKTTHTNVPVRLSSAIPADGAMVLQFSLHCRWQKTPIHCLATGSAMVCFRDTYVAGLTGNTNETMAYVPMSGTLPAQTLTYDGAAHVETVNPANQSHAYSLQMNANIAIDLTQTTPDMDIVLFNGTDYGALSGNATIPVTGDERVSINDLTLDPSTGRFSTTATSTITQRDFVAGATVKTYSNLTLAGGLAGPNGAELGMILGAEDNGSITMQIVGKQRHQ